MIARRQFLASILAAGASPAIVKAASIMRVRPSGIMAPVPGPVVVATEALATPLTAIFGDYFHVDMGGRPNELLASLSLPERWLSSTFVDRTGVIVGARYMSDGTVQPIWRQ